jgi:hypothetical protein
MTLKTKFNFDEWKQMFKTIVLCEKTTISMRQNDSETEPKRLSEYKRLFRNLIFLLNKDDVAVNAIRTEIKAAIDKLAKLIEEYKPAKPVKEVAVQIPTIVAKQTLLACSAHKKGLVKIDELNEFFKPDGELQRWARENKIPFRLPEYTPEEYNPNKPVKNLMARLEVRLKKKSKSKVSKS